MNEVDLPKFSYRAHTTKMIQLPAGIGLLFWFLLFPIMAVTGIAVLAVGLITYIISRLIHSLSYKHSRF